MSQLPRACDRLGVGYEVIEEHHGAFYSTCLGVRTEWVRGHAITHVRLITTYPREEIGLPKTQYDHITLNDNALRQINANHQREARRIKEDEQYVAQQAQGLPRATEPRSVSDQAPRGRD